MEAEHNARRMFHVSKYIKKELVARGWTQADLAFVMGRTTSAISRLMVGSKQLSPEIAQELGVVLGRGAEYWFQLDNAYRISQAEHVDEAVLHRAELFSYPIKQMRKRGWIGETSTASELKYELKRFFGNDELDTIPLLPIEASFKRTLKESLNTSEKAWLARAIQLAVACPAAIFNEAAILNLQRDLRRIAAKSQAVHRVPELLANCGIRYVVVEPLPTVKIDGAAFWLEGKYPVIAMSLRFDNIGSFWFALMHELYHIKNKDTFSFDDLRSSPTNEAEQRANRNAADNLVPQQELEAFIRACSPRYSVARINNLATRLHIHPGIIVGQLQHRQEISYAAHRKLLTKVRDIVTRFAFTDGWGQPVPQLGS